MKSIKVCKISVIILILDTTSKNQSIWKDIKVEVYSIVLAMPEMLFNPYL